MVPNMAILSRAYLKASYYLSKAKNAKAASAKRIRVEKALTDLRDEEPGTSYSVVLLPSAFIDAHMT